VHSIAACRCGESPKKNQSLQGPFLMPDRYSLTCDCGFNGIDMAARSYRRFDCITEWNDRVRGKPITRPAVLMADTGGFYGSNLPTRLLILFTTH